MKKRLLAMVVCVAFLVCLCGCDLFAVNTEELLSPPELTGDMYPIGKALKDSVKGEYILKYPTEGDHRSAIIMEDVNGDGTLEAFAFYSTSTDEQVNMHINYISYKDGEWRAVAEQSIVAGGVERVSFCDLDMDGIQEILVGWEIYSSSEKQLCIYSVSAETLAQRLQQQYTNFVCCDLDSDGTNEVFVQQLNTSEGTNKASVLNITDHGVEQTAGCIMDGTVKTVNEPIVSQLSSGKPAIYIDEFKGAGAITEVLFFSMGELVNPLLDIENAYENVATLRSASLVCKDINSDGILEIPIASDLPSAEPVGEKLYYTNWNSYNGEQLALKMVSIVNLTDGYYLSVPGRLSGNIAVLKDTNNHRREIYAYDTQTQELGEKLAVIDAVSPKKAAKGEGVTEGATEIYRTDNMVYFALAVQSESPLALTIEEIKGMFKIIE